MDAERIAVLEAQGRWQAQETHEMKSDLKEIKDDVKTLLAFKWKVIGIAMFAAFLTTTVVEFARGNL